MAIELVLDASVSLAWFLKETPERADYAAAVSAAAADGAILHVPVQWGIEMGHVLLREHRRKILSRGKLQQAFEDLDSLEPVPPAGLRCPVFPPGAVPGPAVGHAGPWAPAGCKNAPRDPVYGPVTIS